MSRQTRRSFLRKTAAVGLGVTAAISGTKASGRILGANDRIRFAIVGTGGRGSYHVSCYCGLKDDVEITYLVDPDARRLPNNVNAVKQNCGNTPKCAADIRQALDDKNIDAVSIASPNHWHALMAIWACQAGKHVYVEKPCTHNVYEGRKLIEAADKYGVIVQHGTQLRSYQNRADEMAALRSGKYGEVLVAKGYCCKPRWNIGYKPSAQPPKDLDFNLWLGPAPDQTYHANLVPYNWHWFWDTGNGDMGNQGVHQTDIALWGLGKDNTLPNSVWSLGGRWVDGPDWKDQGETPNMLMSVFDFGGPLVIFETRGLVHRKIPGATKTFPARVENEFYTTEGVLRSGMANPAANGMFYPKGDKKPVKVEFEGPKVTPGPKDTPGDAFGNFITAVRAADPKKVNAPIDKGHYASAICHLGNVSYRLGKQMSFNEKPDYLGDNQQVLGALEKIKENLSGVGLKLAETTCCFGPQLTIDPKAEQFVGEHAEAANKLLTREYRKPFVVPEVV